MNGKSRTGLYAFLLLAVYTVCGADIKQDNGSGIEPTLIFNKNLKIQLEISRGFATPGQGDPRGLAWDGSYLWMAEDDTKSLYRIDTLDGSVVDTINTPGNSNTQGLTWDGSHLWHAEYDGRVYKIDPVAKIVVLSFNTPTSRPTGLAWDGTYLWTASYQDDKIYQFSAVDGSLINEFASPTTNPWGLTWSDSTLWNVQNQGGDIFELDPTSGAVKNSYPGTAGHNLLGLTTDGHNLWVVDNTADSLYKVNISAKIDIPSKIDFRRTEFADDYNLLQNYPNPFNPNTRITFSIADGGFVSLKVYNMLGQEVEILVSELLPAGQYTVDWDAKNFPSGTYYYQLETEKGIQSRKALLIK